MGTVGRPVLAVYVMLLAKADFYARFFGTYVLWQFVL
jgi:hypothetical protein